MLLSLCVPTYNRSAFLRQSLRYWIEQLSPFLDRVEVIVADNASTDDTPFVLAEVCRKGIVRQILRPLNLGFNASVHDLVSRQAKGCYIWVCGDDDYLNPGALRKVVSTLEMNPTCDHLHVATQYIPNDRSPDLSREDPRCSPYIRTTPPWRGSALVARTRDLLEIDEGAFSGFYSSIWRREVAIEALSGSFLCEKPFDSLEATLPYAVYIARQRCDRPCLHLNFPVLTVAHTVSWLEYRALFRLRIMPELYRLFRDNGACPRLIRKRLDDLLDHWPREFVDLIRRRGTESAYGFSYFRFLIQNFYRGRFWSELIRAI